jgi:hypothetical protein
MGVVPLPYLFLRAGPGQFEVAEGDVGDCLEGGYRLRAGPDGHRQSSSATAGATPVAR